MIETFRREPAELDASCCIIGTTAALIAAGISAASSIAGAKIASNASQNAAQTQVNAANNAAQYQYLASQNALDFAKQQWAATQANMAPWINYGQGAVTALGTLMGIKPGNSVPAAAPPAYAGPTTGTTVGNLYGANSGARTAPPGSPVVGVAVPRATPIARQASTGQPQLPPVPSAGQASAPPPQLPSYPQTTRTSTSVARVRLEWPDGTQMEVNADQVPQYEQMGAEVLA